MAGWLHALILTLALPDGTTLIALFSIEPSTLRPLTERAVRQITGRAFSIDGNLDARAGRIRLANADWGSSDAMLTIEGV